jgi:hypothetical protein
MAIGVLYLRNLLASMGFPEEPNTPVYKDNTAGIEWGNHLIGGRERAKRIDMRRHFAHDVIQNQEMRVIKIDTRAQLADIFTKPLPYPQFQARVRGILRNRAVIVNPDAGMDTSLKAPSGSELEGGS